jgi:short-subunit dehydrogenase
MAEQTLEGQWALVTGASSGLGMEIAKTLANRGANLLLVARREQRLQRLARSLEMEHRVRVLTVAIDLANRDAAVALYRRVTELGVAVDLLVNNAGFGLYGSELSIPWTKERAMLDLDIHTLVHLTKLFGEEMVARGRGRVMQVSSVSAFQPLPAYAAYSAAKSFVYSYGEALRFEWRNTGVSCTVLAPGVVRTEFLAVSGQRANRFQRGSMMSASDVARIGVAGMLRGRSLVVPGLMNKLTLFLTRLLPRDLAVWLAHRSMREEIFAGDERREHERLNKVVDCWLRFGAVELTGCTRNLSLGGVAILSYTDHRATIHQSAVFGINLPEGEAEAGCRVVRVDGSEIAIAFDDPGAMPWHDLLRVWGQEAAPTGQPGRA